MNSFSKKNNVHIILYYRENRLYYTLSVVFTPDVQSSGLSFPQALMLINYANQM